MSLIGLIILLVLVGAGLYLLNLIPMDAVIRTVIRVVVIVVVVLYAIQLIFGGGPSIRLH